MYPLLSSPHQLQVEEYIADQTTNYRNRLLAKLAWENYKQLTSKLKFVSNLTFIRSNTKRKVIESNPSRFFKIEEG